MRLNPFGRVRAFASIVFIATATIYLSVAEAAGEGDVGPQTSSSSDVLTEVVVTAERRAEKQVDVPISITALSPKELEAANVRTLADIQQLTPSLRFDTQDGFYQPTIRGIGTSLVDAGGGSNVGIYMDGFYSPNPIAADFQMLNVTGVQVLKGPQGTLFGHNTTGGAILVTTADPSTVSHAEINASYGMFNTQRYTAYATTGLTDKIAWNVEGVFDKGNGWQTNIVDGDTHVGAYENWSVRTGLKFDITDKLSMLVRYTHSHVDDPTSVNLNSNTDTTTDLTTGLPWGITTPTTGPYTTNPNQVANDVPTYLHSNHNVYQLTIKADLNFADLTSYTQYREEDTDESINLDQTGLNTFQLGLSPNDKTFSQEFLLVSKPGTALQWTAGAFYFSNQDTYTTFLDNFVPAAGRVHIAGSSSTPESLAAYFDATYQFDPKWFLTVGARYAHDSVKDAWFYTNFTFDKNYEPDISSNKVTPRVVLRYKPTEESSVYASFTQGYKAAIIDIGGSCENPPNYQCHQVDPEEINAFEVGYKYDGHNFTNEAAAFYYDYKNLQVSEFIIDAGVPVASIVNAAKSQIYGLEESLTYKLNQHFDFNLAGSWTHARYKQFGDVVDGTTVGAPIYATCGTGCASYAYVNFDHILYDTHMQHSPDFTANFTPRYTTGETPSGSYSVSGNLAYTSTIYMGPSGTQFRQPGYATLNARTEWRSRSDRYSVAIWGDNLTNARYRTQVSYNALGIGAGWSAPLMVGIEVGARF